MCQNRAEEALAWLRWITGKLGLGLNEAKTRICDAERETFDFLGYTFGPMVFRRTGKTYVGVTPSKKRVKRFKKSLRSELHAGNHAPLEEVVAAVNRKLRGWSRYFSVGTLEPAYKTVDRYTEVLFGSWCEDTRSPGGGPGRLATGTSTRSLASCGCRIAGGCRACMP
ncbi:MAG: hypothetical protein K6T30_08975 [Alicyclobacillus sp.]|nr:hypothetical protein [Alicyclobacillus sp.]